MSAQAHTQKKKYDKLGLRFFYTVITYHENEKDGGKHFVKTSIEPKEPKRGIVPYDGERNRKESEKEEKKEERDAKRQYVVIGTLAPIC